MFICSHSEKAVNLFIEKNNIEIQNFVFVNDCESFILDINKQIEKDELTYPLHIVMDNKGKVLAYLEGGFEKEEDAGILLNFINNL